MLLHTPLLRVLPVLPLCYCSSTRCHCHANVMSPLATAKAAPTASAFPNSFIYAIGGWLRHLLTMRPRYKCQAQRQLDCRWYLQHVTRGGAGCMRQRQSYSTHNFLHVQCFVPSRGACLSAACARCRAKEGPGCTTPTPPGCGRLNASHGLVRVQTLFEHLF